MGLHMYKGVCVCVFVCWGGGRFADLSTFLLFLKYPMKMK